MRKLPTCTHTDMYHMDPYGERWVGQVSVPLSEAVRTGRSESCAVSALRRGMLHVGIMLGLVASSQFWYHMKPGGAAAATGKHQTPFQAPASSGRILSDS